MPEGVAALPHYTMIKLIAFDMDGTIYSSEPILHQSYDVAVKRYNKEYKHNLKTPNVKEIMKLIGLNPTIIYSTLFPELDKQNITFIGRMILEELCKNIKKGGGRLLGNIHKFLPELYKRYRLQVVSNGRREYLKTILEGFELIRYFSPLRTVKENESKAELLKRIMHAESIKPSETIMLGDRANDKEAAVQADVKFIGCNFTDSDDNEITDALFVITDYKELILWLNQQ
ncbi:MAG: HAD family hydrolase [Candidatus Hydrogenedentota bacterium]